MKKIFVTESKIKDLKKELDHLINVKRPEIISMIKESRSQGDLKENADYDFAKNEQAIVEERIKEIEIILNNSVNIDVTNNNHKKSKVNIGSIVTIVPIEFEHDKKQYQQVKIVGEVEYDPLAVPSKISYLSQLAQNLIGHKVGDVVIINAVEPYKVKIIDLSY